MSNRFVEIAVVSDVHLGTFGCHAKELNAYLKSISPRTLILNGDIIDMWQLSKNYFPTEHTKVLRRILKMMQNGTQVYYITGNHDEYLRKFSHIQLGNFKLVNQLTLQLNQDTFWFFHGDIFDVTMQHSKWLAKLGGKGYDYLILFNRFVNWVLELFGKQKMSLSKKVKERVKKAVAWINNFELTAAELGIEQQYDYVICGHIHQAQHRTITTNKGSIVYLNSGDWIENLTALEYHNHEWNIYEFNPKHYSNKKHLSEPEEEVELDLLTKIRYA
jgi:UDP-2,3-diacylglucosamine pyrophosphatase LpxH